MKVLIGSAALLAALSGPCAAQAASIGGSLREQVEHVSDDALGTGGSADTVAQHRLLVNLDLQPRSELRAFLEIGAYVQNGRNGGASPADESAPDLHQGILEWLPNERSQLRIGRQEWTLGSGRLVSVRDGPNIRRAFDGAEFKSQIGSTGLRTLWGHPLRNLNCAFDDRHDDGQRLAAIQFERSLAQHATIELYALDYARDAARFSSGVADEARRSWGLRVHGQREGFDFNTEALWQSGRWGGERIRAWTLANDFGWQLQNVPWSPRLGIKADIASGDRNPQDGRLETFNALYPNPSYFSDAALIAPANLVDLQPNLRVSPSSRLSLTLGWNLLWKHHSADTVYGTPVPLRPVEGSAGRRGAVGQQLQVSGAWRVSKHLSLEASAVRFEPGAVLSGLQDENIDFLQLVLALSW